MQKLSFMKIWKACMNMNQENNIEAFPRFVCFHHGGVINSLNMLIYTCKLCFFDYFCLALIKNTFRAKASNKLASSPGMEFFYPLKQSFWRVRPFPVPCNVLICLGQGRVYMNGAQYFVETNVVSHGADILSN